MSELNPDSESNRGWVYPQIPESIGDRYHPEIVAVLTADGTPSLQGLETTFRPVDESLVDFVIVTAGVPELQTWRLDDGPATPLDLTEVEPWDYNATTNNKHWKFVGASGGSGTGAPVDAKYLTAGANATLSNEVNLGALASGILKSSVSAGIATIAPTQMPYTVNVKDAPYSAVGNGVADDSAAIQAAITDVWNAGGGTIFFPKGVYLCNGAFDGTTNSVLKIPFNSQSNPPISIALIGEVGAPWFSGSGAVITSGTIIKCTKTGTGTRPAILAGAAWSNSPSVTDFNYTYLYIENMSFQTYDDPSINGLQLGTTIGAQLKNVRVDTHPQGGSGITQPTHGTTAIVMPKINDGPLNRCDNVVVSGFDSGYIIGEHFNGPWLMAAACNVGFIFEGVNEGSTANLGSFWCPTVIKFNGVHAADLFLDTERANSGWQTHVREVDDASNWGSGIIRYAIVAAGVGPTGPISTNGGANLRFVDLWNSLDQQAGTKWKFVDTTDRTKKVKFDVSAIATGTTRTITVPNSDVTLGSGGTVVFSNPGGRLTTESGVPVSTSDRTSQGTLYYTPYKHNNIYTYNGSAWVAKTFAEISLALTLTSGKNYDVFINAAADTLSLSSAWTNDTTRADALATQDGVVVLSSDHTKLWLGTIRASGSNVTEDSGGGSTSQVGGKRFVWNAYNQVPRMIKVIDTTDSWSYTTNTIRQANAASGNKVEYVTGDVALMVHANVNCSVSVASNSRAAHVGIGIDSTTTFSGLVIGAYNPGTGVFQQASGHFTGTPGLGYHYVSWNEKGADGTSGFNGDNAGDGTQSGLIATIFH